MCVCYLWGNTKRHGVGGCNPRLFQTSNSSSFKVWWLLSFLCSLACLLLLCFLSVFLIYCLLFPSCLSVGFISERLMRWRGRSFFFFFFSSFLVCLEARRRRSRRRRRRRIIDLAWLVASYFEGFFRVTSMSSDCFLIYQGFFEPWLRFSRASLWILVDGLGSLKDSFERALDSWTWIQGWFFFWFTQLWGWGLYCSKLRYGSLWMAWDPWRIGLQHLYGPFKTRLNSWTWIFNSFVTNSCMKSTLTNTTRLN